MRTLVRYQGEPVEQEWPQLRALHYGDGVFRSLLCWQGEVVDWERQYRKLAADAERLALLTPPRRELESDIAGLISDAGDRAGVIKILLCRAPGARGYAPRTRESRRLATLTPLPEYPASHWTDGIAVGISEVRLSRQPLVAGIKHLNRLEQVLASRGWEAHWQEALLCDDRDDLICGTRVNVFFLMRGRVLVTPELSASGVAGMMRDKVLELAVLLGLPCEVRRIARDELDQVDECFVTNALIGLWPVRQLPERALLAPGPLTCELALRLAHPWQGQA